MNSKTFLGRTWRIFEVILTKTKKNANLITEKCKNFEKAKRESYERSSNENYPGKDIACAVSTVA